MGRADCLTSGSINLYQNFDGGLLGKRRLIGALLVMGPTGISSWRRLTTAGVSLWRRLAGTFPGRLRITSRFFPAWPSGFDGSSSFSMNIHRTNGGGC